MSADPARRPASRPRRGLVAQPPPARDARRRLDHAVRIDRRRRLQHLQRLRRDFLMDALVAIVLVIFALSMTSGLGVMAILEVPVALALIASAVVDRRRRRRRPTARRTARGTSPM
jgi:hypothetical protein